MCAVLYLHVAVEIPQPFLEEHACHPGFAVVAVVEAKLFSRLAVEAARLLSSPDDERLELFRAVGIGRQCDCHAALNVKKELVSL